MISDRDIWRTARAMIEQFCDHAVARPSVRANDFMAEGDVDGASAMDVRCRGDQRTPTDATVTAR
jgi:hypothetical protein